jgi:hypothetical protein
LGDGIDGRGRCDGLRWWGIEQSDDADAAAHDAWDT